MHIRDIKHDARGFTIIELMIATSVLSVMLLMATVMMINIGNLYYKGISQSRIQDNVRSITDEVSKHLELGDHFFLSTSGNEQSYCVGSTRYTFVLDKQIGTSTASPDFQSKHVLWRDANPASSSCPSVLPDLTLTTPSAGGVELITPHSRLTDFTITGTSPYTVSIAEAYGDNDLLCDTNTSNDCTTNSDPATSIVPRLASGGLTGAPSSFNIRCRGSIAEQFCATANLTTTVVKRLP